MFDVVEMLKDAEVRAKLTHWAMMYARGNDDRAAMQACKMVCDFWRQAITSEVIDRVTNSGRWEVTMTREKSSSMLMSQNGAKRRPLEK